MHTDHDDTLVLSSTIPAWTRAFIVMQILGGQVGLPILILTFLFSKTVHRHRTLINFCVTWVIYSVVFSLLIYSGEAGTLDTADPSYLFVPGPVCNAQAVLVHAVPPMIVTAGLVVVLYVRLLLWDPQSAKQSKGMRDARAVLSLAAPYVVGLAFTISAAVVRHKHPQRVVSWHGLYCTFSHGSYHKYAVPVFSLCVSSLLLILQTLMFIRCYQSWKTVGKGFLLADRRISKSLVFRVAVFTVIFIVTFTVSIYDLFDESGGVGPTFLAACLPLIALIVFGSQKDIFRAWLPGKSEEDAEHGDIPTTLRVITMSKVDSLLAVEEGMTPVFVVHPPSSSDVEAGSLPSTPRTCHSFIPHIDTL